MYIIVWSTLKNNKDEINFAFAVFICYFEFIRKSFYSPFIVYIEIRKIEESFCWVFAVLMAEILTVSIDCIESQDGVGHTCFYQFSPLDGPGSWRLSGK